MAYAKTSRDVGFGGDGANRAFSEKVLTHLVSSNERFYAHVPLK